MIVESMYSLAAPLVQQQPTDECEICGKSHKINDCSLLNTPLMSVNDSPTPSYARLTLPQGLEVRSMGEINTIFATKTFPKGIQFGPFIAKTSALMDIRIEYPLKVFLTEEESVYLETYEELFCNWMCFINLSNDLEGLNLFCYQFKSSIYFCTIREIKEGQELKAWYAPHYAEKLGVSAADILNSSNDEYQDIIKSLEEGINTDVEVKCNSPKKKKRRKYLKSDPSCRACHGEVGSKLPGEFLGVKEPKKEWQCPECDLVMTNVAIYARHLMAHYRPVSSSHLCPYCPKRFKKNGYNREIHIRMCKERHNAKNNQNTNNKTVSVNGSVIDTGSVSSESSTKVTDNESSHSSQLLNCLPSVINNNSHTSVMINASIQCSDTSLVKKISSEISDAKHLEEYTQTYFSKENTIFSKSEVKIQNSASFTEKSNNQINCTEISADNPTIEKETVPPMPAPMPVKSSNHLISGSDCEDIRSNLNAPILDLSDDIDFNNMMNSFGDMITDESVLEKTGFSTKGAKSSEFPFDFAPMCQTSSSLDTSTFYSQDNPNFLPMSFTSCDDVTDEEKNRLVESLLFGTDDKFQHSDYEMTDGCVSEDPDADFNLSGEKVNDNVGTNCDNNKSKTKGNFKCDICKKCFMLQKYLYRHLKKHAGEFACNICFMTFARKENLVIHKQRCKPDYPNIQNATGVKATCTICKLQLNSLASLQEHLESHYCKGNEWKCICGMVSEKVELITGHCCPSQSSKKVFCNLCNKLFKTPEDFTKHKGRELKKPKVYKQDLSLVCEYCGLVFRSSPGARLHRASHGEKSFECEICDKKFYRKDMMVIHRARHNKSRFNCDKCKKVWTSEKELQRHYKLVHQKTEYVCSYCHKIYSMRMNLDKHIKKKHKQQSTTSNFYKEPKYQEQMCSFCDKTFRMKKDLTRHMRASHGERYICDYCGTVMLYRYTLKRHLSMRHNDRVDEWDTPQAFESMKCRLNVEDSEEREDPEPSSTKRDLLQSAVDMGLNVLDLMNVEETEERKDPEPSSSKKDLLQSAVDMGLNDLVLMNDSLNEDERLFNIPLSFIDNLEIAAQSLPEQPTIHLSMDTLVPDDQSGALESVVVNFPLNMLPAGCQLALESKPPPVAESVIDTVSVPDEGSVEEEPTVVNFPLNLLPAGCQLTVEDKTLPASDDALDNGDGGAAFVLFDSSMIQSNSLLSDNNVLFYVVESSAADSSL